MEKEAKAKVCSKCKEEKPLTEFNRDNRNKTGYNYLCKICRSISNSLIRDKIREEPKRYLEMRKRSLKSNYNLTIEDYEQMFKEQKGLCAICGKANYNSNNLLYVDHNHTTNKVRGLLCTICNTKLGVIENFEYKKEAIGYLEKYEKNAM